MLFSYWPLEAGPPLDAVCYGLHLTRLWPEGLWLALWPVYEWRLLDGLAAGPESNPRMGRCFLHCIARCAVGVRDVGVAY